VGIIRPWLARYSWEFVTAQNALLCQAKGAIHKPTSDGNDQTQRLGRDQYERLMRLDEAVALCRRCHRLAPFCFYKGNTFAGIIRDVIRELDLPSAQAYVIRSLAGHIVAGVSTGEEEKAFREFCESLNQAG
jgi:hypothetical protein